MRRYFVKSVPSLHHEHRSYKWWVLANIMIGTFMVVLNNTIVNTGLPKIMASEGITLDVAQWISTAFMLAFAVMLPSSGWIADRFGYKRTYAAGLAIFTFFSLCCGLSWDEKSLIFRALFPKMTMLSRSLGSISNFFAIKSFVARKVTASRDGAPTNCCGASREKSAASSSCFTLTAAFVFT
jgi:MFS family permease